MTPESAVARQITDYLRACRLRFRRNQVGAMVRGSRRIPFGEKGEADYTAYIPSKTPNQFYILHIETKAPKGKQSYEQAIWQQCAEANGEWYVLARSFEDVERFLKSKGLK